jgi:hypothetical protein
MSRNKLLREVLYERTFQKNYEVDIVGYELPVLLPDPPPEHLMRNYHLKKDLQFFQYDTFPADFDYWDPVRKNLYVDQMFHIREHGEWWLIGGRQVYITGRFWKFLNYWTPEKGGRCYFREEAMEFFQVWDYSIEVDGKCLGLLDIKPRRVGDTEKCCFIAYDNATRYSNYHSGLMANDNEKAQESFNRIAVAHNLMCKPFKPIHDGKEIPKESLLLSYPSGIMTKANAADTVKYLHPPLGSLIDFVASTPGQYDGVRLGFFLYDETGKISKYHPMQQIQIVGPTMTIYNDTLVIGKMVLPTTVEDFKNGKTVDQVTSIWNNSNPTEKMVNGRTPTGLYRIFRNAELSADMDKFGFHKRKEEIQRLQDLFHDYMEKKKYDELTALKRKFPITITDALSMPASDCILLPHLLDAQIGLLRLGLNSAGYPLENPGVRGDLLWVNGIGSEVKWVSNPKGRWFITQHPISPNNNSRKTGRLEPGNRLHYSFGGDPIDDGTGDTSSPESKLSRGALVVRRKFNPLIDNEDSGIEFMPDGDRGTMKIMNPHRLVTGKPVCSYCHKPDTPQEFFEDALKTAMYYGSAIFLETNRSYVRNMFIQEGFAGFLAMKPKEAVNNPRARNTTKEYGSKSTEFIIDLYIDYLKNDIYEFVGANEHLDLLVDMRSFTGNNRKERDLTVAYGFSHVHEMDGRFKPQNESKKSGWNTSLWSRK